MVKLAKSASEVTSAVKEGSIRSGTTVKNFQELSFAAKQSGASVGTLQRAFDVVNTGGSKLEKSLGELGIRLKDGGGHARDAGDIFRELADKISQINDPSERAAKAAEILGRRVGPQLVELLSAGGKGIDELGQKAHNLGIIFTESGAQGRQGLWRRSRPSRRYRHGRGHARGLGVWPKLHQGI